MSDEAIKVVRLSRKGKCLVVSSYGEQRLGKGMMEQGHIINQQAVVDNIKKALSEAKPEPIKCKKAVFSIPEIKAFIRTIKIPKMTDKEIGEAIKWETEANIPITLDKVYLDWQIIKEEEKQNEVLVAAVPKQIVDSYYDTAVLAGIEPVAIEVDIIATVRGLTIERGDLSPFLIADIGSGRTIIAICKNQVPYFTSSVPVSGRSFTEALQKELGVDEEEAEKIKKTFKTKNNDKTAIIDKIYSPLVENLAQEIEKSSIFYNETINAKSDIEAIVITGGSALIKSLPEKLSKRLGKRVVVGNISLNIHQKKCPQITIPESELSRFVTPIGLALRAYDYENYTKSSS